MTTVERMANENHESGDPYLQYRALSVSAVASMILAIMSLPALLLPTLLVLPAIGIAVGLYSVATLRKRQSEFVGYKVAVVGLIASFLILATGGGYAFYDYSTEVPEGYERISFEQLQPDKVNAPQFPIPPSAVALDGKRIFVKGYVHPGLDRRKGIRQFVLVPDMKTCCFGGQPELTDMIEVTLKEPLRIDYSYARRRLAGTLKVSPHKKPVSGLDGVYYQLEADYVR
ncbi:MAG: DUF3299 domain-containing protein [Planctomycetales bacterium]|nr:DUF3299 domain-containing protein [Planctomycetales bacterium]